MTRATGAAQVSVVVTHYEQPVQLARTLAGLAEQTFPADRLEVVVADDGSAREPVVPDGVRLVRQEDRGFRAAAVRNLGARAATGDVLVFLDADTCPEPGFVAAMARRPAEVPHAVVVGRRRYGRYGMGPASRVRVGEYPEPAWLADGWARTRNLADADETSFRFVISAVLACSAAFFADLGGFDETFAAYGGEDWEWAHRAWTHGALLAHEPDAVAWHDGPDRAGRDEATEAATGTALAESLAVADRIPVPFVAPRGLLGATGDPLVTLAPSLVGSLDDALVLTLDSLLVALPRARVLLPSDIVAALPADPRLVPYDGADPLAAPPARSAVRHLYVHRAVTGPPSAWLPPAGSAGAAHAVVIDSDGAPALTWTTLRAERIARRDDSPLPTAVRSTAALDPVPPGTTVAARWGGWA